MLPVCSLKMDNEMMKIICDQEHRVTGNSAVAFFSLISVVSKRTSFCNCGLLPSSRQIFASQKLEASRFQKLATNFFRVLSVVMIPIAATVPSVCMES